MKGRLGHVAFFRKALTHAQIITRYGASNNQIVRTNYFTNSIDIGNAAWGKDNVTILTDRTDLFGSNIADKIVETANNNYHRIYQTTSAPLGKQTTISCYAKAAERGNLALQITDGGANNAYGLSQQPTTLSLTSTQGICEHKNGCCSKWNVSMFCHMGWNTKFSSGISLSL
jgi:hypothetical protein